MRWLLFFLALAAQGTGLLLLRRSGWFTGRAVKTGRLKKYFAPAATAVRSSFIVFFIGGALMLFFALWEHHFILALGQITASALCLLGGRMPDSGPAPGGTSRKTGIL